MATYHVTQLKTIRRIILSHQIKIKIVYNQIQTPLKEMLGSNPNI